MSKKIMLSLTMFLSSMSYAQNLCSFKGYFDKDRKLDTVNFQSIESTTSTLFSVSCKFSTRSLPVTFDCEYDYSDFVFKCPIPDIVYSRQSFADSLAHKMIPGASSNMDNGAIRWMAEICFNKYYIRDNDFAADYGSSFSFNWERKKDGFLNASYCSTTDTFRNCFPGVNLNDRTHYWVLFYMGNNHGRLTQSFGLDSCSVFITKHGVLLEKEDRWTWLFINEETVLHTGVEKLRWASIVDAKPFKNNIIIQTISLPGENKNTFAISVNSKKMYHFKENVKDSAIENFIQQTGDTVIYHSY